MSEERRVENVTCLGCGCGCDDLTVRVEGDRIAEVSPACPVGRSWFGDGRLPSRILSDGQETSLGQALERLAQLLLDARGSCLVYIGADLTTQAQRAALQIADMIRATVDTETSATAAQGLLTAQRRGRAGATLGEVRNRGDVFLFWGVDPREHYPRFLSRYSLEPVGIQVPEGRRGRFVISVSVAADRSLAPADLMLELTPEQEIEALSLIRVAVSGNRAPALSQLPDLARVAERLTGARYAVLVHDAEPTAEQRNPLRAEALIALAQALNSPTRAALVSLRAGGNRVGAESALTWQTGYPFAVDYSPGYPRYRPDQRGSTGSSRYRGVLVVGSAPLNDSGLRSAGSMAGVIGPRASQTSLPAGIAVDTGVAGIHEEGTAYRMDDVPLTLRPPLSVPHSTTAVLTSLAQAIQDRLRVTPP
jgi:formylmethanofuran dehydrogenase subunit B